MEFEGIAKLHHVTGIQETMTIHDDGRITLYYTLDSARPAILDCPDSNLTVELGQSMVKSGDPISGPKFELSYPATIEFTERHTG